jgi:hypothetical protein
MDNMPISNKSISVAFLLIIALAIVSLFTSCTERSQSKSSTGVVVDRSELSAHVGSAFLPDTHYAVVSYDWIAQFHTQWKADLFRKGVTRWDERFDCNKFAASLAAAAQLEFYRENFHSDTKAQALAIGEIWYFPNGSTLIGHAIVAAYTDRGLVFIEPQGDGSTMSLSDTEIRSIFFKRF